MSSLEARLEEQEIIIKFLTSKYEKDTGRRLPLPSTLSHLLGDKSIMGNVKPLEDEEFKTIDTEDANANDVPKKAPKPRRLNMTMMEAIEAMNIPKPLAKEKGKESKKKEINLAPELTLTKIDLSGFRVTGVSRSALKELLDAVEVLPAIRSINLSNNGLTDDCEREILALFDFPKVKSIDLSQNSLKKLPSAIGKKLRDEIVHIMWLDLTQNDFDTDVAAHALIISGLKKQKDLIHVGLTTGKEPTIENPMQPKVEVKPTATGNKLKTRQGTAIKGSQSD